MPQGTAVYVIAYHYTQGPKIASHGTQCQEIQNPSSSKNVVTQNTNSHQGLASLIVMIAVLTIIILFCCFAAPGIRGLCKKYVFRSCPYDDPEIDNVSTPRPESATPTVILLPHGRMLVVDRSVLAQLQVDSTGIDFIELSANLIRAQRQQIGSTPSILDSDTTSKGISPTSLGLSPPAYDDIFGEKYLDLPPSYSEVSLVLRQHTEQMSYLRNQVQPTLNLRSVSYGAMENIELTNRGNINNNNENDALQESSLIIRNPLDNHVSMVIFNNNPNRAMLTNSEEEHYTISNSYDHNNERNIETILTNLNGDHEMTNNECIEMDCINSSDSVSNFCDNNNASFSPTEPVEVRTDNNIVQINVDNELINNHFAVDLV